MARLDSGFTALRNRNYRLYWSGLIVSMIGTWMQSVSQPWLVLELGGSPIQLGIVLALQFTPSLFLAPLGGVLADRVDKRRLLMATQTVAMTQAILLFVLTFAGVVEIWHVMVLALGLGFVNAVDMPVRQSFAPDLVPREDLMNAIALNSASFNLARVLGPAVAGVTLAAFGPAFNFAINAASYSGVLTALWRMDPARITRMPPPERGTSVRTSLAEGVRFAVRTPTVLWPLVLLGGISIFGLNYQTLLPLFARNTLELGAEGYGALFAAMGLGSLTGSLSLAFMGGRRPLLPLILGGGLAFVVFQALLGATRSPIASYPLIYLVGLSSMLMINTINVIVQHSVPNELRGRVMALYVTVFAGSSPIGGIFAGSVAQVWGPPAGFVLGAGLASLFVALVAWQLVVLGKAWASPSDALSIASAEPDS
jgi:MFS family permease